MTDVTIDHAYGDVEPSRPGAGPAADPPRPAPSRAAIERTTRDLLRRERQRAARVRAT